MFGSAHHYCIITSFHYGMRQLNRQMSCVLQHFQQVTSSHDLHGGNFSIAAGREAFAG